jgi:hypothetical protein
VRSCAGAGAGAAEGAGAEVRVRQEKQNKKNPKSGIEPPTVCLVAWRQNH